MDILVHVDRHDGCQNRLAVAVALARAWEARLIGMAVAPDPEMAKVGPIAANLQGLLRDAMAESKAAAAAQFKKAVARAPIDSEFRFELGAAEDCIARQACYADLTLVGQTDPDEDVKEWLDHSVPLTVGGPVLVVPYIGCKDFNAQRPLVAWNGTREAARAVKDGLPFLRRAQVVDVLSVAAAETDVEQARSDSTDMCAFLSRHGVRVEGHNTLASDIEVGDLILSRAADFGSDLLVMGAYGHSRFREVILGGVTRTVLTSMPVPVLLAH